MTLISLGFACRVRESIDRFNGFRTETNFFDWLISNFSTVLFVIQNIDNSSNFLNHNKFVKKGIFFNNLTHNTVDHTELYFSSLHDFPINIDYNIYMDTFLEKYKRRLLRLKKIILNNNEKIHFIHMIPFETMIPTIEEIYNFIMKIKEINPNCDFCLHLLVPPELHCNASNVNLLVICSNVKAHYMLETSPNQPKNEQRLELNWTDIYKSIVTS